MTEPVFLIVTASIGSGHVKAAEAIAGEIRRQQPTARVEVVDFSAWQNSWATAFMKACYLAMLKFVPDLYNCMYRFTGGRYGGLSIQSLISLVTRRDISRLVKKYSPTAVICTHPFPAGAVSIYRRSSKRKFCSAVVITDYSVHQMWIYTNADRYFVARETMKNDLMAAGLPQEKVFVSGIPISPGTDRDPADIRREWGIAPERPAILIMGGGLGLGGVETVLAELERVETPLELLVVAGYNEELAGRARELAQTSRHHIIVWGYTDKVRELMTVATLLVSKPGALTISEALATGLPMLLHSPIPGPETDNAVYISRRGAAVWLGSRDLGHELAALITDAEKLSLMRHTAAQLKKPQAAARIVTELRQALAE